MLQPQFYMYINLNHLFKLFIRISLSVQTNSKSLTLHLTKVAFLNLKGQKQPPQVFCKKRCSQKFHKNHWKTPVSVSFSIKMQAFTIYYGKYQLIAVVDFIFFSKNERLCNTLPCEFCYFRKLLNYFFADRFLLCL